MEQRTILNRIDAGMMIIRGMSCTGARWPEGDLMYVIDDLETQKTIHADDTLPIVFLVADVINGVQEGDVKEDIPYEDILDQDAFFDSLANLPDDTVIGAYVTPRMYRRIFEEYGIDGYSVLG